jgi:hypothetical protein
MSGVSFAPRATREEQSAPKTPAWVPQDRAGFPEFASRLSEALLPIRRLSEALRPIRRLRRGVGSGDIGPGERELLPQQVVVKRFIQRDSPYRGLLLYHGLGSGKTCAAIVASGALSPAPVFVLLPASLRQNYQDEVAKCGSPATRITMVSYNGLTHARLQELCGGPDNVFDDAVVVVDEVHNFVSKVINGGMVTPLYTRILTARRCRVLLLSGTPLVNRPAELAYLVNLVHGQVRVHALRLPRLLEKEQEDRLRSCPALLELRQVPVQAAQAELRVRLAPEGFETRDGGATVQAAPGATERQQLQQVQAALAGMGVRGAGAWRPAYRLLLPLDTQEFDAHFVDAEENVLVNQEVLLRRVLGTVSYYPGHDRRMYPRMTGVKLVRVPMSPRQLAEYTLQRNVERVRERAQQLARGRRGGQGQGQGDGGEGGSKLYRAFSRAVCNFVFPEDVPRPYMSLRDTQDDEDAADQEPGQGQDPPAGQGQDPPAEQDRGRAEKAYLRALDDAVARLRGQPGRLALGEGLEELSPKMAALLRHLRARQSTAIIYSEFRRTEGMTLLAAALDANGWSQLRVEHQLSEGLRVVDPGPAPRYILYRSTPEADVNECLLRVFNDQLDGVPGGVLAGLRAAAGGKTGRTLTNKHGELAQLLLITKSGAEGITTRNVREVHVLEPFWHANRVEQVIGRAVRANSHADLPPAERAVAAYVYLATLTPEQLRASPTLARLDGGLTSDEFVHQVAARKRRLLEPMLDLVKRAAVDCNPNSGLRIGDRVPESSCYSPPRGLPPGAPLYGMDLDEDLRAWALQRRARLVPVRVGGSRYYADPATGDLYVYDALRLRNVLERAPGGRRVDPAKLGGTRRPPSPSPVKLPRG